MKLLELVLEAADLDAQRDFYGAVLGFEQVGDATFRAGAARLEFRRTGSDAKAAHHVAFHVPSNLFVEAKEWLSERVPLLRKGTKDDFFFGFWNAHACYALDADGNVIELMALHELAVERPPPFDAQTILGIAEVGLPVPDVLAAVEAIGRTFGELPRNRVKPDPTFTAVGAYDGCFIVVPAGRAWFPTELAAAAGALEVTFAGEPARELVLAAGQRLRCRAENVG